jgi:hypothetical protein
MDVIGIQVIPIMGWIITILSLCMFDLETREFETI